MLRKKTHRRFESYAKLKQLFKTFQDTLNPHLDSSALKGVGVDVSMVNLHEETAHGGPWYLPISQGRLDALDERPDFCPSFMMDDEKWNEPDAYVFLRVFHKQLTETRGNSSFRAYRKTKWSAKGSVQDLFNPSNSQRGLGREVGWSATFVRRGTGTLQILLDSTTGRCK